MCTCSKVQEQSLACQRSSPSPPGCKIEVNHGGPEGIHLDPHNLVPCVSKKTWTEGRRTSARHVYSGYLSRPDPDGKPWDPTSLTPNYCLVHGEPGSNYRPLNENTHDSWEPSRLLSRRPSPPQGAPDVWVRESGRHGVGPHEPVTDERQWYLR